MIAQNNFEINQVTRRHPRMVVYVKIENGPSHYDFVNVQDGGDVAFLEKRWALPISETKEALAGAFALLTWPEEEAIRHRKVPEMPSEPGPELDEYLKSLVEREPSEMHKFLSKSFNEQTQQVVLKFRDVLRQAWRGDSTALQIAQAVAQLSLKIAPTEKGQLELTADNPLAIACVRFLHDFGAWPGICANPDCPAPFFVRSRGTQKFCDVPACMVYSHRVSANKYWANYRKKKHVKKKGKR